MALTPEALAEVGGATVLPDDRVVDKFARLAVPYDRCFALIGDADRGHVLWSCASPR